MNIIDNRLTDAKSEPQLIENFNRVLAIIDTLAEVTAEIDESLLFKVTFDSDGGSEISNQYIIEGEKVEEPTEPTKDGYIFSKWMNGEEEYDFNEPVTTHIALKATWILDE